MDERLRFVARLLEGEKTAPLCAEFGISRKTGYKIYDRYTDTGADRVHGSQPTAGSPGESPAGADRGDHRPAEARVPGMERAEDPRETAAARHTATAARHQHRACGARPARTGAPPTAPAAGPHPHAPLATEPNARWCADYKGEFMLGNRRYCYPLTITDFASRYLLTCDALSTTQERFAFTAFDRAFHEFGLPRAIRTDNGVPFAGATALYRLSKLAVWWLRLGIQIERIQPGILSKTAGTNACIGR